MNCMEQRGGIWKPRFSVLSADNTSETLNVGRHFWNVPAGQAPSRGSAEGFSSPDSVLELFVLEEIPIANSDCVCGKKVGVW